MAAPVRVLTALILAAHTAACVDGNKPRSEMFVRDSAGIRIVEHPTTSRSLAERWIATERGVIIGGADSQLGHELHRVVGGTRLRDGTIIVGNAGSSELRRYDSSGTYLGHWGGRGDGPGEFVALAGLGRMGGDTVLAWDRGKGLITVFTHTGTRAHMYRPSLPEEPSSQLIIGSLSGGRLLFARGPDYVPTEEAEGIQRPPISAWLVTAEGALEREFGPYPGPEVFVRVETNSGIPSRTPVPLGARTIIAASGDHVYSADTHGFDVWTWRSDGTPVRIIRRGAQPLAVSAQAIASDIDNRLQGLPPGVARSVRLRLEAVPWPQAAPSIRSMVADEHGYVWIQPADAQSDIWTIFDPAGQLLGDVRLPVAGSILEIGEEYLLVLARDELEVESIHLLELTRGGA